MRAPCGSEITTALAEHAALCDYCAGYLERERELLGERRSNLTAEQSLQQRPAPKWGARFLSRWRDRRAGVDRRGTSGNRRGTVGERRT